MKPRRSTIALIAHDNMKAEMIEFVHHYSVVLSGFEVVATDGTARRLDDTGLAVSTCGHGPSGGDVTIAAAVATDQVAAVFFFLDPSVPHPHAVDVGALIRQCCIHDVPLALNVSTALSIATGLATGALGAMPSARSAASAARAGVSATADLPRQSSGGLSATAVR